LSPVVEDEAEEEYDQDTTHLPKIYHEKKRGEKRRGEERREEVNN
jgi:hypothetical protein